MIKTISLLQKKKKRKIVPPNLFLYTNIILHLQKRFFVAQKVFENIEYFSLEIYILTQWKSKYSVSWKN